MRLFSCCLETALLHLTVLIAYYFMFLRFINVLQMEENIATNTGFVAHF